MRRLHYEPDAMAEVLQELMTEADPEGKLTLFYNSRFVSPDTHNRRIRTCVLYTPEGMVTVCPKQVIDCTADILPARMADCSWALGEDARETYEEEAAPEKASRFLNGLTQCFRITQTGNEKPTVPVAYADVDLTGWVEYMNSTMGPVSCFNAYPRGGIYVNMLPTGWEDLYLEYDMPSLKHICEARHILPIYTTRLMFM